MKKTILLCLCIVALLLSFSSCEQDLNNTTDGENYKTPTITGKISVPSTSGLSASDIWYKVVSGESTVVVDTVKEDGSFVVSNLDSDKEYNICFTSIEPDHDNISRDIAKDSSKGYGGWLSNVTAAVGEANNVGSVKMKPLGTIKGVAEYSGLDEHYDIWVYIPGTSYMARTGANGEFSISNVPQGTHTLRYTADDYIAQMVNNVLLRGEGDTDSPTITTSKVVLKSSTGEVKGNIKLEGSSDGSAGINVKLESVDGLSSLSGTTSSDGSFDISKVAPGKYKILASYYGYVDKTSEVFSVNAATTTVIPDFELTANGGSLSGTAELERATSFDLITVWATSSDGKHTYSTTTDSEGSFLFSNCYPDTYTLSYSKEGYIDLSPETKYTIVAGSAIEAKKQLLEIKKGTITGKVSLNGESDYSNVTVSVIGTSFETKTDSDGNYVFIIPQGNYKGLSFSKSCFVTREIESSIALLANNTVKTNAVELQDAHNWDDGTITVAPTCITKGTKVYTCADCGITKTEILDIVDHIWDSGEVTKEASHTEDGIKTYTCQVCNETRTEAIPAMVDAHTFSSDWTTDATSHWHASTCGHDIVSDRGEHSWTEEGFCSICGTSYIETLFTITNDGIISVSDIEKLPSDLAIPSTVFGIEVSTISASAFEGCTQLKSVVIPDTVTAIKYYAFRNCVNLESVVLSDSIASIGSGAFWGCSSLTEIDIPESLNTKIPDFAFYDCSSLETVTIGESVPAIGVQAFVGCSNLESVFLPNSLTSIESSAFAGCVNLVSIHYDGTLEQWNSITKKSGWDKNVPDSTNIICSDHAGHSFSKDWSSDETHHWHDATCAHTELKADKDIHSYPDNWTYDPDLGCMTKTCSVCGKVIKTDHLHNSDNLVYHAAVSHSCTQDGTIAYYQCKDCGKYYSDINATIELESIVDPAAHDMIAHEAVDATCESDGNVAYWSCSSCKKYFSDESGTKEIVKDSWTIKAVGHNYGEWEIVSDSTCTATGLKQRICANDETHVESEVIPLKDHNWSNTTVVLAPTCVKTGIYSYTCSDCGESKLEAVPIDLVNGHSWNSGEVTRAATCTTDGIRTYTCSLCGTTKTEVIPAFGHTYYAKVTDPTCTEKGFTTHKCATCGDTYIDTEIEALGHILTHHDAVAPTCTGSGNVEYWSCSRCGKYFSDSDGINEFGSILIPALGHSFSAEWDSDSTYHWHTATCGHDVISEKGEHSWNFVGVSKNPTCTEDGAYEYTCSICGASKYEKMESFGHIKTTVWEHVDGNDVYKYKKCRVCDEVFDEPLAIGDQGPAGGYIFYDKGYYSDGWRYIEAAPTDLEIDGITYFLFGCNIANYYIGTQTSYNIGAGKDNTQILVNILGDSPYKSYETNNGETQVYAAKGCYDYVCNGYDDWYLPSKDELNMMWTNLYNAGVGGGFSYVTYWSSSEDSSNNRNVWSQYFDNGEQNSTYRGYYKTSWTDACPRIHKVRPIRYF